MNFKSLAAAIGCLFTSAASRSNVYHKTWSQKADVFISIGVFLEENSYANNGVNTRIHSISMCPGEQSLRSPQAYSRPERSFLMGPASLCHNQHREG